MSDNKYDSLVDLDTLREYALDFADAGFRVMRLHGMDGDGRCLCGWDLCGEKTWGKHPQAKRWTELPHTSADAIDNWFEYGSVRHGLGCVLEKSVVVIDIDVRNGGQESLKKLEDAIDVNLTSESTLIIEGARGDGGKHLWFTKPEDVNIRKTHPEYPGIDFLSAGSYVVLPGSVHNCGGVYSTHGECNPGKISPAPDALVTLIEKKLTISESNAEPGSCDVDLLRKALDHIPNEQDTPYDEVWLALGMGLHHESNGGEYGWNLWLDWSEKGPKHDSKQMRYKWESFANRPSEAVYNGGTVFRIAKEHGWQVDYERDYGIDLSEFLNRIQNGEAKKVVHEKNGVEYENSSLPSRLQRPPGMIGVICDWIMSNAQKPLYLPSLAAAISFCGVAMGRDYCSERSNYTNQYFIILAETGGGKEHCRKSLNRLLDACGLSKASKGKPTSQGAIHTSLIDSPLALFTLDEMGHLLEAANVRGSKEALELRPAFMELFGLSDSFYAPTEYSRMTDLKNGVEEVDSVDLTVRNPNVSIYGMTTPEKLIENITKMLIDDGFINRFCIIQAHEGVQSMNWNFQQRPVPQGVMDWVETLNNRHAEQFPQGWQSRFKYNMPCGEVNIAFSAESYSRLKEFEKWVVKNQNDKKSGVAKLYARVLEHVMKLSMVIAMAKNPNCNEIDIESVEWAIDWMKYHTEQFVRLVRFEMVESAQEGKYRDALRTIDKFGADGVKKTELYKESPFKGLKTQEKNEIIQHLMETEQVWYKKEMQPEGRRGAPSNKFYSSKYVTFDEESS